MLYLSRAAGCKLQGLGAGVRRLQLKGQIAKKLVYIDWCYGLARKISKESIAEFMVELNQVIQEQHHSVAVDAQPADHFFMGDAPEVAQRQGGGQGEKAAAELQGQGGKVVAKLQGGGQEEKETADPRSQGEKVAAQLLSDVPKSGKATIFRRSLRRRRKERRRLRPR